MNLFPLTCDQIDLIRYSKNPPASLLNLTVYIEIDDEINEPLFYKTVET